ncbi:MAG: alkaline phosphatase [candidate division Zixibacteria bacterium]|nr:alkaline phosphatase [Candidatus Tariuqbacter arcticus]
MILRRGWKLIVISSVLLLCVIALWSTAGRKRVNVIFIVPDGMSPAVWASVRAVSVGYGGETNLDRMPHSALFTAYAADSWISESASAITAMMTGSKTKRGVLNQDSTAEYNKWSGENMETLMEYAFKCGMATGIVTNTEIYNATPAGCYAHTHNRKDYEDITRQLVDGSFKPDIVMGGGRKYMKPDTYSDPESGKPGLRKDSRDLVSEMISLGYKYVESRADFAEWNPRVERRALGLFEYENMDYEIERRWDELGEPGLWEMTEKALEALSQDADGFFLMVEGGRIDHAAHANDADRLLFECIALDKTVGVVLDFLKENPNTLVIVAADHGCGGAEGIAVELEKDVMTDFGFPGPYYDDDGDGFPDDLRVEKPVVIGWASSPEDFVNKRKKKMAKGHHTSGDLVVFSAGEGSNFVNGFMDNADIYNLMKFVLPAGEEKEGTMINLTGGVDINVEMRKEHTAVFNFKLDEGRRVRIEISDMDGDVWGEFETISDGKTDYFVWDAKKAGAESPGIYKFRWFVDDEFRGRHTFIVR